MVRGKYGVAWECVQLLRDRLTPLDTIPIIGYIKVSLHYGVLQVFQTYNGMNLSKSIRNPKSNLRRILDYLYTKGEATRSDIFRDVFGKSIVEYDTYLHIWNYGVPNVVSRGWNCNVFSLGVKYGYFKKVRRGNNVFYSVG